MLINFVLSTRYFQRDTVMKIVRNNGVREKVLLEDMKSDT